MVRVGTTQAHKKARTKRKVMYNRKLIFNYGHAEVPFTTWKYCFHIEAKIDY